MQPTISLTKTILADFSHHTFKRSDTFYWSSAHGIIFYSAIESIEHIWTLLHEISHAELKHKYYTTDIALIRHEAEAWRHATTIAANYGLSISDDYIQDHLDTYRQWMHARSVCPNCKQSGLQTQNTYRCINCRCSWRANEARLCALRRFRLPK